MDWQSQDLEGRASPTGGDKVGRFSKRLNSSRNGNGDERHQAQEGFEPTPPPDHDGQQPTAAAYDGHGRPPTVEDGQRPSQTDSDRQGPTWSSPQKLEAHTLTTHDATALFEQLGVPRSQRSIERYCRRSDLDCWVDPDLQVYYITRESIERLAGHFKEIEARKGGGLEQGRAPGGDTTHQQGHRSGDGQQASVDNEELARMRRDLEDLQRANRDLEINSRVKDEMIKRADQELNRHVEERQFLVGKIEEAHRMLGAAEAQLRALKAPDDNPRQDTPRADER